MRNLESFGVQELNAKEIRETEGGWIWITISSGWFNTVSLLPPGHYYA